MGGRLFNRSGSFVVVPLALRLHHRVRFRHGHGGVARGSFATFVIGSLRRLVHRPWRCAHVQAVPPRWASKGHLSRRLLWRARNRVLEEPRARVLHGRVRSDVGEKVFSMTSAETRTRGG